MFSDSYLKWFDKHGKPRPAHSEHVREEDIQRNMVKLIPHTWKQEGNRLIGYVDGGTKISQTIPTNYLLIGTDDKGLPIFKKL